MRSPPPSTGPQSGDTDALAARAISLLTDEKLYQSVAAAARKTAGDRFCSTLIIPKYEQYYARICS